MNNKYRIIGIATYLLAMITAAALFAWFHPIAALVLSVAYLAWVFSPCSLMSNGKSKIALIIGLALASVIGAQAQNILTNIPSITGQTVTINGQSYVLTLTNGVYTATTTGPSGTVSVTSPTSYTDALNMIEQIVVNNNPANADYYGTNEFTIKLGAIYEQNSGQAAALIGITKWGWIPNEPIGFELGLLQGNQNGTSGTAGAYGAVDYRYIIGDVSANAGLGFGYDNYNERPFLLIKSGVEYRLSKQVGSFVDLNYALETKGNASRGFGFAAGVTYSFESLTGFLKK